MLKKQNIEMLKMRLRLFRTAPQKLDIILVECGSVSAQPHDIVRNKTLLFVENLHLGFKNLDIVLYLGNLLLVFGFQ